MKCNELEVKIVSSISTQIYNWNKHNSFGMAGLITMKFIAEANINKMKKMTKPDFWNSISDIYKDSQRSWDSFQPRGDTSFKYILPFLYCSKHNETYLHFSDAEKSLSYEKWYK